MRLDEVSHKEAVTHVGLLGAFRNELLEGFFTSLVDESAHPQNLMVVPRRCHSFNKSPSTCSEHTHGNGFWGRQEG